MNNGTVPIDFPVRPVSLAPGMTECGTCGRAWDDTIATEYTPVPAGRCPFEAFHNPPEFYGEAAPAVRMIPLRDAFIGVLHRVAEDGYANLDADNFDDKEDFDMAMSNAIGEAIEALNLPPEWHSGDLLGELYDFAEEASYTWPDDEESDDADEE